jgi:hypothetical protein
MGNTIHTFSKKFFIHISWRNKFCSLQTWRGKILTVTYKSKLSDLLTNNNRFKKVNRHVINISTEINPEYKFYPPTKRTLCLEYHLEGG